MPQTNFSVSATDELLATAIWVSSHANPTVRSPCNTVAASERASVVHCGLKRRSCAAAEANRKHSANAVRSIC